MDPQNAQVLDAAKAGAHGHLPDSGIALNPRSSATRSRHLTLETSSVASTVIPQPSLLPSSPAVSSSRSLVSHALRSTAGSNSWEHYQAALDDFTEKWVRGEVADAGVYLDCLGEAPPALAVQLIYREYCLAEMKGMKPDPAVFLDRFPAHRELLDRLFAVHQVCSSSQLDDWLDPTIRTNVWPQPSDEIGPYRLRRELGRGAFARVYLAEERDLESRLVILKLSTRRTREPWLLARARHSHIVEILSHSVVDDGAFQLICMPFLGGATFSEVLNLRRQLRRPQASRGSLLKDLDAVAAPEYTSVSAARPAREILSTLTESQAMAWITARLADALDHAQCQNVIHGDVKPSNILLTADGNPMLLDFNLARNWSLEESGKAVDEVGGTLAYMAPERLNQLATAGITSPDPLCSSDLDHSKSKDPHSADTYSLGIVLLEALTERTPVEAMGGGPHSTLPHKDLRGVAAEYGLFREQGASAVIRAFESASARKIPAALRAILERCLAVRPADRYRRSLELAEDLDRWRTDLPLAYAREPFWTYTLPRCIRRSKKVLIAASLVVAACLVTAYLVIANIQTRSTLQEMAKHKLARNWDDMESHAFQFQRPHTARLQNPDSPEVVTTAVHALKEYDVLGRRDWRKREEVRNLPKKDRDDLTLWLMEQAYRYCRSLGDRPNSPGDWQRALLAIDRVGTNPPLQVFDALRRRLLSRLNRDRVHGPQNQLQSGTGAGPEPHPELLTPPQAELPWLDDYLLGVAAELDGDEPETAARSPVSPSAGAPQPASLPLEPAAAVPPFAPRGASRALFHYERALTRSPDSFWTHYRAAAVCFQLQRWSEAAGHLDCCLRQRPDNPALRGQFASCLSQMLLFDYALDECSRAVEAAPDYAEFYRSRAFIRVFRGQADGLEEDLNRFEMLRRSLVRGFFHDPPGQGAADPLSAAVPASQRALDLEFKPGFTAPQGDPLVEPDELDPDELNARAALAVTIISKAGTNWLRDEPADADRAAREAHGSSPNALAIAAAELEKVLTLDPRNLTARMARIGQLLEQDRLKEVRSDLDLILSRPDLIAELRKDPQLFPFLHQAINRFARHGLIAEALRIAEMTVSCSNELKRFRSQSYYYKAQALSVAARSDPSQLADAARQLQLAFRGNAKFRVWYQREKIFDPVRTRLDAALDQLREINTDD